MYFLADVQGRIEWSVVEERSDSKGTWISKQNLQSVPVIGIRVCRIVSISRQ